MKKLVVFAICSACLFMAGCGSSNPMVGTWKLELDGQAKELPEAMKPVATAEFKSDNTFNVNMTMGERKEELSGTYALDGKSLTMNVTMEGGKPSTEKETVTLSDDMKSFPLPGPSGMGNMVKQ